MSTKFTNRSLDFPDIEFHFVSGSPGSDGGRQIRKVSPSLDTNTVQSIMIKSGCLMCVSVQLSVPHAHIPC